MKLKAEWILDGAVISAPEGRILGYREGEVEGGKNWKEFTVEILL